MRKAKKLKVLGPNKNELYLSFLIVLAGVLMTAHRPQNFNDLCITTSSCLLAFVCSLNAVCDLKRMNWFERALAVTWFALLLWATPISLWHAATHDGVFADR